METYVGFFGRDLGLADMASTWRNGADDPNRHGARRDSSNGTLWNAPDHSGLTLPNLITFDHFLVSSAMKFPNSAVFIGAGSMPKVFRRA